MKVRRKLFREWGDLGLVVVPGSIPLSVGSILVVVVTTTICHFYNDFSQTTQFQTR